MYSAHNEHIHVHVHVLCMLTCITAGRAQIWEDGTTGSSCGDDWPTLAPWKLLPAGRVEVQEHDRRPAEASVRIRKAAASGGACSNDIVMYSWAQTEVIPCCSCSLSRLVSIWVTARLASWLNVAWLDSTKQLSHQKSVLWCDASTFQCRIKREHFQVPTKTGPVASLLDRQRKVVQLPRVQVNQHHFASDGSRINFVEVLGPQRTDPWAKRERGARLGHIQCDNPLMLPTYNPYRKVPNMGILLWVYSLLAFQKPTRRRTLQMVLI